MTRILIAATMAASLFATNLLAADAAGPLAPGHASGVKKAQDAAWGMTALYVGVAALGAALLFTSTGQQDRTHPVAPAATSS